MSFAVVFGGQGMQHPLMLPWLAEDAIVRSTCALLGIGHWRERMQDKAWATANANAQILLTGLSLAAWHQMASDLPDPACMAGYSVGELAAFSAAGVFDTACALELARERARAMDRCAREAPGGLSAVTGLPISTIESICSCCGAVIAICNGAERVVLGGSDDALACAERCAGARGARTTRLAVAVASHTPSMRGAAEEFKRLLVTKTFGRPQVPLFSNTMQRVQDAAQAARALAAQMATTVRWDDCMESIRARAPVCVLEIGPGQSLARMWNRLYPEIPARSCDDFRRRSTLVDWIAGLGNA